MPEDKYKTNNLYEASALIISQTEFIGLETEGNHFLFVFNDPPYCQSVISNFLNKKLTGNLKEYSESIKTLKTLVFNRRK